MNLSLQTKVIVWFSGVILIFAVNSLLGISALRELRHATTIQVRDSELAIRARQIRESFFEYHNHGISAALTLDPAEATRREEGRQRLLDELNTDFGPMVSPELRLHFDRVKSQILEILAYWDRSPSHLKQKIFLDPTYRDLYGAAYEDIRRLTALSSQLVAQDLARHEQFFYANLRVTVAIFFLSVLVLCVGFIGFRHDIVKPFLKVLKMVQNLRNGDLSARVSDCGTDEIGLMGRTLNQMADELQHRREDRVKFIGSIVHDIRNPLTAIGMNCDLAIKYPTQLSTEQAGKIFKSVKAQVDRVRRLTDDLLEASHEGQPHWKLELSFFSFSRIVKDAVDFFMESHPDHHFKFYELKRGVDIFADRDRISQILVNLLSNAVKYSPAGSEITVVTDADETHVSCEVRDRGIGIPEEAREAIFNAYTRLESGGRLSQGSGLGLTIVKEVVSAHRGAIQVSSNEGGGTIFKFTLPTKAMGENLLAGLKRVLRTEPRVIL